MSAPQPRRILVTGNLGYVGPAIIDELRAAHPEAELIGFDAGYFAHCLSGGAAVPERKLDCQYFGDVRRPPQGLLDGVDTIVHLAAISNDPIGNQYRAVTLAINAEATAALAASAKRAGASSFVLASSCSVYGFSSGGTVSEASPPNPLTPYAESKWLAERQLSELADERFTVASLRFGTACGMSDRLRLDVVLNDFVAAAVTTGQITLLSDGSPWRPLIHIRDMARAVNWAIARPEAVTTPFLALNVGSERWNYRISDLAEEVAATIGDTRVLFDGSAGPDTRSYRVDFGLFESLAPNHQPKIDLRAAVGDLYAGLQDMGFDDANFRSSRFIRLRVLDDLRQRGLLSDKLEWRVPANDGRGRSGRSADELATSGRGQSRSKM